MIRRGVLVVVCFLACNEPPGSGAGAGSRPCEQGATRCTTSGEVQTCEAGEWASEQACPGELVCLSGQCRDASTLCEPGSVRCDINGRRERCDDSGSWTAHRCDAGTACIDDGACADRICEPGQRRCADPGDGTLPQRQLCADDGLAWLADACRRGELCVENGRCQRQRCSPRSRGCADERTPAVCNDDGMAWNPEDPCPPAHRCTGSGRCISACEEARSRQSYDGCEFFAVDLPQIAEAQRRQDVHPYAVVIANPHNEAVHVGATAVGEAVVELVASQDVGGTMVYSEVRDGQGQVQRISGRFDALEVPAQGVGTFILPSNSAGTQVDGNTVRFGSEKEARAYRIRTDLPVTAYQFQPLCCNISYTNDASILIPVGSQGRRFFGVSAPHNNRSGFLSIVGSERSSDVEIALGDRRISQVPGHAVENGILRARIEPYQVLTIMTNGGSGLQSDLTGVAITASEEVGVFGGHVCTQIPDGMSACDHLETSVMAVETWRNEAVGAHTFLRSDSPNEMNYYRLVAAEDGTRINFENDFASVADRGAIMRGLPSCEATGQGNEVALDAGQWCGFGSRSDFVLRANRPFQLVQMISGQETTRQGFPPRGPDHAGDPAMTTVPPTDQYRTEYTFLTPETYYAQYVNVVHPPGAIIELDGITMNPAAMGSNQLPSLVLDDQPVGRGDAWRLSTIKVSAGRHQILSMTGDTFGIMVYAYDDYVSYAYPGGMNLEKL